MQPNSTTEHLDRIEATLRTRGLFRGALESLRAIRQQFEEAESFRYNAEHALKLDHAEELAELERKASAGSPVTLPAPSLSPHKSGVGITLSERAEVLRLLDQQIWGKEPVTSAHWDALRARLAMAQQSPENDAKDAVARTQEAQYARLEAVAIKKAIEPLTKVAANWKDCPQKGDEVALARIDLKAQIAALTTERDELARYAEEVKRAVAPLDFRESEWVPSAIKRALRERNESRERTVALTVERDALEAAQAGKSATLLAEFAGYCRVNPSLRFWQALLDWSGFEFLRGEIGEMRQDTFYMEDRGPASMKNKPVSLAPVSPFGDASANRDREIIAKLLSAVKGYRHWFDTCTRTLAPDWERHACDASENLDAALLAMAQLPPDDDAQPRGANPEMALTPLEEVDPYFAKSGLSDSDLEQIAQNIVTQLKLGPYAKDAFLASLKRVRDGK